MFRCWFISSAAWCSCWALSIKARLLKSARVCGFSGPWIFLCSVNARQLVSSTSLFSPLAWSLVASLSDRKVRSDDLLQMPSCCCWVTDASSPLLAYTLLDKKRYLLSTISSVVLWSDSLLEVCVVSWATLESSRKRCCIFLVRSPNGWNYGEKMPDPAHWPLICVDTSTAIPSRPG